MVKQGSRFGVKLKATAPSIHLIKTNVETEVSPIVGSEKQSEELVNYLLSGFESDPKKIWESNIFGKSLHELVNGDTVELEDLTGRKITYQITRNIRKNCK